MHIHTEHHTAGPLVPLLASGTGRHLTATGEVGELLGTAALLNSQPLPGRGNVAILAGTGEAGSRTADACTGAGLSVPRLPAHLSRSLLAELPAAASADNPVCAMRAGDLGSCVRLLLGSPALDAVVLTLAAPARSARVRSG
ncbi:hypothetical protein [Streptomyces axinellae]|uniref:Uncharacterized protein n=1 Tax=Streptomyces axinellae TaxID=552788 RepID=A0ABP6BX26_9ACTN